MDFSSHFFSHSPSPNFSVDPWKKKKFFSPLKLLLPFLFCSLKQSIKTRSHFHKIVSPILRVKKYSAYTKLLAAYMYKAWRNFYEFSLLTIQDVNEFSLLILNLLRQDTVVVDLKDLWERWVISSLFLRLFFGGSKTQIHRLRRLHRLHRLRWKSTDWLTDYTDWLIFRNFLKIPSLCFIFW